MTYAHANILLEQWGTRKHWEGGDNMDKIGESNLRHVMDDDCTDPECGIHHPDVGIQEGTVSLTNLAFYIAGAAAFKLMAQGDLEEAIEENFRENFIHYHEEAFNTYPKRTLETDLLEDR